ncbi:uncharacterized protein LOC129118988 isoform X1 [Agelaius phoeniceus]|uniref:uncharacterized protein LOC129118988 isoform X1 n=1 Tax=Agelaius phoeniceus TaxID=39638 RepID=UPI004054A23D
MCRSTFFSVSRIFLLRSLRTEMEPITICWLWSVGWRWFSNRGILDWSPVQCLLDDQSWSSCVGAVSSPSLLKGGVKILVSSLVLGTLKHRHNQQPSSHPSHPVPALRRSTSASRQRRPWSLPLSCRRRCMAGRAAPSPPHPPASELLDGVAPLPLQPWASQRFLPRLQPQSRSRSSTASHTPRPARRHDDCLRCSSDGTHACAVATTPAPMISLRADSSNHSAASGISCTHAQFYLHGPAATPHCFCRSFGTARSWFRAAACRCPATAGIPVPCHTTSAATVSIHGTTAGENCSALHVSFCVSPSAGHREIPLQCRA